ncbi:MAG: Glu-tRNA(Gln) amidotransferase subunit GatE [Phycisphaerales bacterium]|nr:MAG: Glu-tRNA(Gln) amidotransferase subunit GatE [Phycisphaerales bacterium]
MSEIPLFGTVGDEEYAALGFRCGLEVHQQLLTERKLFCRCPAGVYCREYDAEILRHMRPTLSELGEYDGTALMEFKTRKNIIYQLNFETVCTYEMDDSPPFQINDRAVDITLRIGMMFNLNLIDELHIARKQYLDGSIPTGFQRTTIVGVNGWMPYRGRKVGIRQLALEEDSCREVSDEGHMRTYIGDRLGMPLIETVTEPHMYTPHEVAEVGQLIRLVVVSTADVRRGIGSARQDVNVSVEGGTRIEIKGVPRIPLIPRLTHYEAFRQKTLLEIRDELRARGVRPDDWKAPRADVTGVMQPCPFAPIAKAVERGCRVMALALPGFEGLLSRSTQPHTPFLQEFSDRVRVVACIQERPNVLCSDMDAQLLKPGQWGKIQKALGVGSGDVMILVWGEPRDAETAANEVEIRAIDAMKGVPSETRQALADGTNGFERILPGPDRMYPDTDLPPIAIASERRERMTQKLPERPWDRIGRYARMGVPEGMARELVLCQQAEMFDGVISQARGVKPSLVAYMLVCERKNARRQGLPVDVLSVGFWSDLFVLAGERGWPKEVVHDLMYQALGAGRDLTRAEMSALAPDALVSDGVAEQVEAILRRAEFRLRKGERSEEERRRLFAMGTVMRELRGRADGRAIRKCVDRNLGIGAPEGEAI